MELADVEDFKRTDQEAAFAWSEMKEESTMLANEEKARATGEANEHQAN